MLFPRKNDGFVAKQPEISFLRWIQKTRSEKNQLWQSDKNQTFRDRLVTVGPNLPEMINRFWSVINRQWANVSGPSVLGRNFIVLVDTLSISKCFHDLTPQIFYRFSTYWKSCHPNPKMGSN